MGQYHTLSYPIVYALCYDYEVIVFSGNGLKMKIITIPDIHGRIDKMKPYIDKIKSADLVILAGDLTNGDLDTAKIVLTEIAKYNPNILAIPGNMDTDAIVAYTDERGYSIHKSHRMIDGVAFVGVGGALPFAGSYVYSEDELEQILATAIDGLNPDIPQILVSHQPPYGTLNDKLYDGRQVGSHAVRAYIDKHQPLICFTGHIHEAIGIDTIGQTQVCNPGPVWKGYATSEIINGELLHLDIQSII